MKTHILTAAISLALNGIIIYLVYTETGTSTAVFATLVAVRLELIDLFTAIKRHKGLTP